MKKVLAFLLALMCMFSFAVFTACDGANSTDNNSDTENEGGSGNEGEGGEDHVHSWNDGEVTLDATCTIDGVLTYTCTSCGETKTEAIPATGHTGGDAVKENEKSATCIENGSYDNVVYCTVCNAEISRETITITTTGHTLTKTDRVEATCTEEGNIEYWYCSVCGKYFSDESGHTEISSESLATPMTDHTHDGYESNASGHWQVCAVCDAKTDTQGHTFNSENICTVCGYEYKDEYVSFGTYPQTLVSDTSITTELETLAGTLPSGSDNYKWTSYGYTQVAESSGTENSETESTTTDYMWYIDLTYSGETYRGVYYTSYRPYCSDYISSESNSYQDDNGYYVNTLYWFKYESVLWRILAEETSDGQTYTTLVSEMIIDSQAYQDNYIYTGGYYYATDSDGNILTDSNGNKIYANNYAYSTIRTWLNNEFYNMAFSDTEKAAIQLVTVSNVASTTDSGSNKYACENTEDYVWLLSYQEVLNIAYGFSDSANGYDTARQKSTSDYAQCQGAWVSTSSAGYKGNGYWWLRSPSSGVSVYSYRCDYYGAASGSYYAYNNFMGVCPAIKVKMS